MDYTEKNIPGVDPSVELHKTSVPWLFKGPTIVGISRLYALFVAVSIIRSAFFSTGYLRPGIVDAVIGLVFGILGGQVAGRRAVNAVRHWTVEQRSIGSALFARKSNPGLPDWQDCVKWCTWAFVASVILSMLACINLNLHWPWYADMNSPGTGIDPLIRSFSPYTFLTCTAAEFCCVARAINRWYREMSD